MAFSRKIKEFALDMADAGFDRDAIHAELKREFGFGGTREIIAYWMKNANTLREKFAADDEMEAKEDAAISEELTEDLDSINTIDDEDYDPEEEELIKKQLIRLRRSRQNLMDNNRILRKMFREQDRVINASRALLQHIKQQMPRTAPVPFEPFTVEAEGQTVGIAQFSDWHLNECVIPEDTKGKNKYDFYVASKRMQKYADKLIRHFKAYGVTKIVLAFTGDQFNSTRRKDEVLRQATSLAGALLIGADLVTNFIQDLARHFAIEVVTVFGNESRLDDDISSVDFMNNLDYLLHHMLEARLANQENVLFHEVITDHETLIQVNGANILLWHGHNRTKPDNIIVKYSRMGIIVHYIISGHLHHTSLTEAIGQSSSGVGDNGYNFHRLNKVSRAAQNMYLVDRGHSWPEITPIPIDIQEYDQYPGYAVPKNAHEYEQRKSVTKGVPGETILRIVA